MISGEELNDNYLDFIVLYKVKMKTT